ncbi:hypothetical protein LF1_33430 [Rubripirellula obstinata]|uniref:ATP-binding protein n=2 Tax=Rubripirellula obstinata TaxID=406547 RepID=A0A5B1CKG3_9BACT|nr:hypothetical protein LF1_33430 [Rubripirellula obstinata]
MIDMDLDSVCDAGRLSDGPAWQPWSRLNLFRNPFGELSIAERAELAIVNENLLDQITLDLRTAIEFIGDCGRGKSTRLHWLGSRLPQATYVYLPEEGPVPAIPFGNPLIIDEAQRMNRSAKRSVFATGVPLILGTHQSLSRCLRRWGYQVQSVRIGQQNTASLIQQILNRRIEASRSGDGPIPIVSAQEAGWLFDEFGSDLRSVEGFMYEQFQRRIADLMDRD